MQTSSPLFRASRSFAKGDHLGLGRVDENAANCFTDATRRFSRLDDRATIRSGRSWPAAGKRVNPGDVLGQTRPLRRQFSFPPDANPIEAEAEQDDPKSDGGLRNDHHDVSEDWNGGQAGEQKITGR
jgi:hypothetical protein